VLAFLFSAWLGTRLVVLLTHERLDASRVALSVVVYVGLWLLLFKRLGLYERSFAMTIQDEIYATIAALSLGIAPQLILFSIVPSLSSSRLVLLCSLALSIATVTTTRVIAHRARDLEQLDRERRVALVGSSERLRAVCEELRSVPNVNILPIAVDNLDLAMATEDTSSPAAFESMVWFVKVLRWECDTLIFTDVPDSRHVPGLLAASRRWGVQIAFATPRIRAYAYALAADMLGHQALLVPRPVRAATPAARFVKRAFDVAISLGVLIASSPLMLLCALALRTQNAGDVLLRQTCIGRNGRRFERMSFKTTGHDGRTTAVGGVLLRLHLDRLPQFANVLAGGMSVVGPRAHRAGLVEAVRAFNPRYDERTVVRPGLTGWAQAHFKFTENENADAERELPHDLFYIENWGMFLDFYIVVKAICELAARFVASFSPQTAS
jgi:lipopolysaccharide/colanic/teichoic acid biosynthesis glycosyltransferase